MPVYQFEALDSQGKEVRGEIRADAREEALRLLAQRGMTPLEVGEMGARGPASMPGPVPSSRLTMAERVSLLMEMATLLGGGVSVSEMLASLAEAHEGGPLGPPLARLDRDVRAGSTLSDAMRKLDIGLPPYVDALCRAGEASGNMAGVLQDAARQLDYERRVAQELRSALVYPAVLVLAGAAAVLIIFVAVVPRFANLIKGSRADIPDFSRWVIEAGIFAKTNFVALSVAAAGLAIIFGALLASPAVRAGLREALIRLPLLGPWLIQVEVGRWATIMGSLLMNRVPIMESMALSISAVSSRVIAEDLLEAARQLQRGIALADSLRDCAWFPRSRLNLVRVGERSGDLPRMLNTLGSMETEAARVTQARVVALIEPAAILLIGAVIAAIVLAVMMAITGLNTSVG